MDQATHDPFLSAAQRNISGAATWGLVAAATAATSTLLSAIHEIKTAMQSVQGGPMEALLAVGTVVTLVIGGLMAMFLIQASLAFRSATFTGEPGAQQIVRGLRKLRSYFKTMGIMFLVGIGFGVIGFIAVGGM